jgi:hypothetical protein
MTLFADGRLLISLPAAEIAALDLPGSIMTADQAVALPVSHTLACAVALIESHCRERGVTTSYLARPEIFTHGVSESWLRDRLGKISQHLCMTDASTVKHVVGCRTHVFLYRLTHYDSYESFARLCRRAPDLMARVATQVNTRFAWGEAADRHRPEPLYLHALRAPPALLAAAYPFQFRPHQIAEIAERIARAHPLPPDALPPAPHTLYIPLTETALANLAFVRAVSRLIRAAFTQPHALLLRLPAERPGETLTTRIARTLTALATAEVILPRNIPPNIHFLTSDLVAETAPTSLAITLHEDFDFWRHPQSFYEAATAVTVVASVARAPGTADLPELEFLPADVREVYGSRAVRLWLPPPHA